MKQVEFTLKRLKRVIFYIALFIFIEKLQSSEPSYSKYDIPTPYRSETPIIKPPYISREELLPKESKKTREDYERVINQQNEELLKKERILNDQRQALQECSVKQSQTSQLREVVKGKNAKIANLERKLKVIEQDAQKAKILNQELNKSKKENEECKLHFNNCKNMCKRSIESFELDRYIFLAQHQSNKIDKMIKNIKLHLEKRSSKEFIYQQYQVLQDLYKDFRGTVQTCEQIDTEKNIQSKNLEKLKIKNINYDIEISVLSKQVISFMQLGKLARLRTWLGSFVTKPEETKKPEYEKREKQQSFPMPTTYQGPEYTYETEEEQAKSFEEFVRGTISEHEAKKSS